MAPFRSSRNTRAGPTRGQNDNDTLDGLPIRQWRKVDAVVGATDATIADVPRRGVGIWKELPMPDGHLNYPEHSQKLLRAARVGRILHSEEIIRNIYRKGRGDDEKDADADGAEEGLNEDTRGTKRDAQGFSVKRWAQIRQQEETSPEYLAKRRDGLPSTHRIPAVDATNTRQIRVRGVDANKNPLIYEMLIPQGKSISSDYIEVTETMPGDDELVAKPSPGSMIEGLGVANENGVIVYREAPVQLFGRGRQPPPRRKPKRGPGRGKKKIGFAPVANTMGTAGVQSGDGSGDVMMINTEDGTAITPAAGDDDGEDGEDGEDEDEEDGEGEDGDADPDADAENDDDREDGELTPEPAPGDAATALEQFKSNSKPLLPPESLPSELPPAGPGSVPHVQQEVDVSSEGSYEPTLNTATLAPEADTEMEESYEPELAVPAQAPISSSYETGTIPKVDTPTEDSYEPSLEISTHEPAAVLEATLMGNQSELATQTSATDSGGLPISAETTSTAGTAPSLPLPSTGLQIPGLSLSASPQTAVEPSAVEQAPAAVQGEGSSTTETAPQTSAPDVLSSLERDLGEEQGQPREGGAAEWSIDIGEDLTIEERTAFIGELVTEHNLIKEERARLLHFNATCIDVANERNRKAVNAAGLYDHCQEVMRLYHGGVHGDPRLTWDHRIEIQGWSDVVRAEFVDEFRNKRDRTAAEFREALDRVEDNDRKIRRIEEQAEALREKIETQNIFLRQQIIIAQCFPLDPV